MTKFIPILLIGILFCSCVPQRKIVYAQSDGDETAYAYNPTGLNSIHIQPFDLLYIYVGSIDQETHNFFNHQSNNFNSLSEVTASILAYTVDDSGFVNLPVVGKVKLAGLKLSEAEALIRLTCADVISNPLVSVRYVNSSVTILGEVLHPGTYTYTKEQMTIFRALGMAGDIGEYGNRKKVAVIREKGKSIEKHYIDLTSDKIFTSDYYYLRPNDVVYVEPLKIRRFGMKEYPFALLVSAISSSFVIFYYFKK